MKPPLFAELCCGSAAVTLALLGGLPARPPVSYMGSKRGYAAAILAAMGLRPGQGADAVLLCDPGPWSKVWSVLSTPEGCREVAATIRGWVDEEPRALWERLRAGKPLEGGTTSGEVAAWLAMTQRSVRGQAWKGFMPADSGPRTMTHSGGDNYQPAAPAPEVEALAGMRWPPTAFVRDGRIDPAEVAAWLYVAGHSNPFGNDLAPPYRRPEGNADGSWAAPPRTWLWERIRRLPAMSPATIATDARSVDPGVLPSGSVIYIDPPYQGTTGYAHDLPRADVLAMALRWQAAGALVVVSEAEPLPLPGWHHIEITGERVGQRRTFSKQQAEWLTMSRPPAVRFGGQSSLFGAP